MASSGLTILFSGMLAGGSNSNSGGYRLANTSSSTSSASSSTRASGRTESLVPMPATGPE